MSVSTTGDSLDEADETFTLTLSSPTKATLDDATATGTIIDDDGIALSGFTLAPKNSSPSGIWSDGHTAWVADVDDARLYAYSRTDGERLPDEDISTGPVPMGVWSDGETMWVAGLSGGLWAHRLAGGSRQVWRDLALEANTAPAGVWSDGETAWVSDWLGDTVHAYRLSDGRREAGRDVKLAGGNLLPVGLWSDGETLWVADWRERVYAYRLSDGGRDPQRDIEAGAGDTDPTGLWSGGGTLLATGWEGGEVRAYRLPEAVAGAPGKKPGASLTARAVSLPALADVALQAAIGAALGKAPGEAMSAQELAGLEALTARNAGIRDLSGLEQAVGLKELDLGFNPLADLRPLAGLPALEWLSLDGAAADLQALASLARLQRLSLRHNGLDDLGPLAGLTSPYRTGSGRQQYRRPAPARGPGQSGCPASGPESHRGPVAAGIPGRPRGAGSGSEPHQGLAAAGGAGPVAGPAAWRQRLGGASPAGRAGRSAGSRPGRQRRRGPAGAVAPGRAATSGPARQRGGGLEAAESAAVAGLGACRREPDRGPRAAKWPPGADSGRAGRPAAAERRRREKRASASAVTVACPVNG